MKRDGEIEKCYTINGIAHIAKNNKLMKINNLKDLQELFPEYVFDNSDHAYTINGIVHIAKNNKLMKIHHLKGLQELFPEYVFDNSDRTE